MKRERGGRKRRERRGGGKRRGERGEKERGREMSGSIEKMYEDQKKLIVCKRTRK